MPIKPTFERLPGPLDTLPESPHWHAKTQQLFWVDHATKTLNSIQFPSRQYDAIYLATNGNLRFLAARNTCSLVIGSERGLYDYDLKEQTLIPIYHPLPLLPDTVINDGTVSPTGQIVIAVSDVHETNPCGGFFHMPNDVWEPLKGNIIVANGPAFSADGSMLYMSDTLNKRILRYHTKTRTFGEDITFIEQEGFPDGLYMDHMNCLNISFWGGANVGVFDVGRETLSTFDVVGTNATCCCRLILDGAERLAVTICDDNPCFDNGVYIH